MSDEMKRELNAVKARLGHVETKLDRTMITVARMAGEISEIKHDLATKVATKDDISMLKKSIDAFAGRQQVRDFQWSKHQFLLDDHDKRLTRLEARRP